MRKIIEFKVRGLRCRGTVHVPPISGNFEGLGVIALHPGFLPRSALGDGCVTLAEGLARKGILTVRVDQPGLGDSEGDLPSEALAFLQVVERGELADDALECLEQVKSQLGLERIIIGGLCGGAMTGFFSLSSRPERWVAGMFAVETNFNLLFAGEAPGTAKESGTVRATLWDVRHAAYEFSRKAILKTPLGAPLQKIYQAARGRPVPSSNLPGQALLPGGANVELLRRAAKVIRSGMPLLFVTAEPTQKDLEPKFDYVRWLLAANHGRTLDKRVLGTDHGFTAGDGMTRLIEHVTEWIAAEFSTANQRQAALLRSP